MAGAGIKGMSEVEAQVQMITSNRMPGLVASEHALAAFLSIQRDMARLVLDDERSTMDGRVKAIQTSEAELEQNLAKLKETLQTESGRAEFTAIDKTWAEMKATQSTIVDPALRNDDETAKAALSKWRENGNKLEELLTRTSERRGADAEAAGATAHAAYEQARTLELVASGIAFAVALGLAFFLARRMVSGARAVQAVVSSIAENCAVFLEQGLGALARNDLTVAVVPVTKPIAKYGSDEIGQTAEATNRMLGRLQSAIAGYETARANLQETIGEVQRAAVGVADTSAQLGNASSQTGAAVQQVAAAVQQVAAGAQ
ncbi:MAG: cell wall metabolism sensor histidine kinase WalK, partial [Chloroflexota bacterium]|nr:cell wall metabolism sensor histidine kinase WalK [Chloroflexota bacterium]